MYGGYVNYGQNSVSKLMDAGLGVAFQVLYRGVAHNR